MSLSEEISPLLVGDSSLDVYIHPYLRRERESMGEREFTEEEIQDLTDRVFLLQQQLDEEKIHFAAHLVDDFRRSYEAIRLRSDGLVDPVTVDGRIRAATLAIRHFRYRQDAKSSISIGDIQEAYFTLLYRELGWLMDHMIEKGVTPHQVSLAVIKDSKLVKQICQGLPELANDLKEFWDTVGDPGAFHLQDGDQLKATFSGDLFPAHWENAVSTAGLYVDTIVLPCPVMRIAPLIGLYPEEEITRLFVKHVLTAMTYREVATAGLTPPVALILPHPDDLRRGEHKGLISRAEPAILKHGAYLFGREFTALDEFREFCESLRTIDQVVVELKGPDRILFDSEWGRSPEAQLGRVMSEPYPNLPGFDPAIAGNHVFGASLGRMPQALGAQENATHFGGTPLINAETSWRYYTWFLEYESIKSIRDVRATKSAHVSRALVSEANQNLSWLGNVPPATVLEIRRNGQTEELRRILSAGIDELVALKPDNYYRTADKVVENLNRAFEEHQRKLLEARDKKLKLYGIDVGSFVATGAIAITAALTANPALGAVSGLLGISGLPNLKDIKSKFKEQAEEDRARKSSPTGLLFRHIK